MLIACLLLASGSFLLVVGLFAFQYVNTAPVPYERGLFPDLEALFTFAMAGSLLLLLGWIFMGASVRDLRTVGSGRRVQGVRWSLWASVLGFVVAYLVVVFEYPFPGNALAAFLPMYAPAVYGPVVAAQAVLFFLASRLLPTKVAPAMLVTASLVLFATALTALALAVSSSSSLLFIVGGPPKEAVFSGVMGGGYVLAAVAFRLGSRPHAETPSPSPAFSL